MKDFLFDEAFSKAEKELLHSNKNIFLTGRAGVGKSTLLNILKKKWKKNVVLLAPTGVAALNINGETIHSFFSFKPSITLEEAKKLALRLKNRKREFYEAIDLIVIDEISMVRADLLDSVDIFLKTILDNFKPFGGVQMVFIGDLYQLPPVVTEEEKVVFEKIYETPYFFSSKIMNDKMFDLHFIELERVFRQSDPQFIELLNGIRNNTISEENLTKLNQAALKKVEDDEGYVYLTSTNALSQKINEEKLIKLPEKEFFVEADISGEVEKKDFPTEDFLKLKKNAQVMLLVNHPKGLWVNGSIGKIIDFEDEKIVIELTNHKIVEVKKFEWIMYRYIFDEKNKKIEQEEKGSFFQYPIKLAWAITIHKSQGKTFEKVIVDLSRGSFAHGQVYVALSRAKSFDYLVLKKPLKKSDILLDLRVVKFLVEFQYKLSEKKCSKEEKIKLIQEAILKKKKIKICYLKTNDEKTFRMIVPEVLEEMEYDHRKFLGLRAYCENKKEQRVFKIDRILEMEVVSN